MTHAAKAAIRQDGAACGRRPAASASGGADERPLGVGADGVSTEPHVRHLGDAAGELFPLTGGVGPGRGAEIDDAHARGDVAPPRRETPGRPRGRARRARGRPRSSARAHSCRPAPFDPVRPSCPIPHLTSPMRRLRRLDRRRRLLLQRQEPRGQRVELLLLPLDDLPLLGDLPRQLLDGLFLFGGADLERRQSVGRHDHGRVLGWRQSIRVRN